MSWLFSRALVEAYSGASSSVGEPSAQLSGTPTPLLFCAPDRTTEFSRLSRFGMTFRPLTDALGADVLMWFLADSPARISALPEAEVESKANALACGDTWLGSFARWDRDSSSWKTLQYSLLEDSELFSETWPRWGMMRDGVCWELSTPAPRIDESEFGFLPTPTATAGGYNQSPGENSKVRPGLEMARHNLWPTPTVCGNYNRKGASATSGDGLATAVKNWATPCARDFRHPGRSRLERTGGKHGECLPQQVGGALNPTWVEWLMGWPLGWTDCGASATDRFRQWQHSHGESSASTSVDRAA
jgi:hypothetical protein